MTQNLICRRGSSREYPGVKVIEKACLQFDRSDVYAFSGKCLGSSTSKTISEKFFLIHLFSRVISRQLPL